MYKILFYDLEEDKYLDYLKNKLSKQFSIYFITSRNEIQSSENFVVINVNNYNAKIDDCTRLQQKYDFSLFKVAAADRIMTNYTNFLNYEKYSNYNYEEIERLLIKYSLALDGTIPNIDYVFTNSADNFRALLCSNIAKYYNKPCIGWYNLYWYNDGMLPIDTVVQTSSMVAIKYQENYRSNSNINNTIEEIFKNKKFSWHFEDSYTYPLVKRIALVVNRRSSYNKLSIKNWLIRKTMSKISCWQEKTLLTYYKSFSENDKFVLFPLHIAPEASLLGNSIEHADQFSLIKNISLNLPLGVKLFVKIHPQQACGLGINYDFLKRLQTIQNITLIDKNIDVYNLIESKNCLAVAVISGTLGLEAALQRKPVFIFGNIYYDVAHCFIKPKDFYDFFQNIKKILSNEYTFDEKSLLSILSAIDSSVVKTNTPLSAMRTTDELYDSSFIDEMIENTIKAYKEIGL